MVNVKDIKLCSMLGLTFAYFLVQIVASHVTHSLTLLMSSYQMLYNILTLLGCLGSLKMSREKSLRNTFGWARVEVLGMMMSILFLAALSFSVVVEAVQTMVHASHQDAMHHPLAVLAIAGAGLLLNGICFVLLGGYTHEGSCFIYVQGKDVEVNIVLLDDERRQKEVRECPDGEPSRSSMWGDLILKFCRDISTCVLVVLCSCLVYFYGGDIALFADPLLSILAVFILMTTSYPYVKQSGLILLQTIPENIDVDSLKKRLIQKFPSILNVHDTHVWRLARNKIIATCHVICMSPKEYSLIADLIDDFFHSEGITLVTIQPEFIKYDSPVESTECILSCDNLKCQAMRCCGESDAGQGLGHDDYEHTIHHRSNIPVEQSKLQEFESIQLSDENLQQITTV